MLPGFFHVGRFKVVEVGTGPVQLAIDGMPGTMDELVGVACAPDHFPRRVVELGAGDRGSVPPPCPQPLHRGVPRPAHGIPHPAHLRVGRSSGESHPRLVGEYRAARRPRPQIEENHVTRLEGPVLSHHRLIVGIRGIGLKRGNRRMIGEEPLAIERPHHPVLEIGLSHHPPAGEFAAGPANRLLGSRGQRLGGAPVTRQLRVRPAGGEARHQRSRRHDSRAAGLDQLHHTVGHAVEIGHVVVRRHLHRDGVTGDDGA